MHYKKIKKIFTEIVPCLLTFGILICFCVKDNNFLNLIKVYPKLNKFYLSLSVLMIFLYWLFDALATKEIAPNIFFWFKEYINLTMYGQFYGAITPFSSGSQPAQIVFMRKKGASAGEAISILSKKFFVSQLCTTTISSLSIIFKGHLFKDAIPGFRILTTLGLLIQSSGLIFLVLFYLNKVKMVKIINFLIKMGSKAKIIKKSEEIIKKIENQFSYLIKNNFFSGLNFKLFLCCFAQILSIYTIPFFVAKSFNLVGFPIFDMIAMQTFVTLLSITTPLPGAAGMTEGLLTIFYKNFLNVEDIYTSMILCRMISYFFGLLISFFWSKKYPA